MTVILQGSKPSVIHNTAKTTGGGVRLASKLPLDALLRFVKVEGNAAPNNPDVSVVATSIQVLWSNADNVLPSDSRDGF